MSVGRRGPLSFLDTEWRTALWRRWVASHLTPESMVPPADSNGVATQPVSPAPRAAETPASEPTIPNDAEHLPNLPRQRALPDDTRRNERRADVRARFDALSERLLGLEDAIDVIARRMSHRSRRERSTDRRTAELVESIAESVEAHAAALDGLGTTLERIERRLERLTNREDGERRDSRAPNKARHSEPPRTMQPPRLDDTGDFSLGREASDEEEASISGSSIRGSIGDMSLSTVLAMLEIERRSGRLKVQGDDGSLVAFELEEGSVVGSRVSENDVDAVESLREVLTWKNGRFWFRQNPTDSVIVPPRSVNSLLLEATRQIDEAVRAG
ncbi:MAG: DUF4388 domain-containing protein [Polyangiaceae bacterium]